MNRGVGVIPSVMLAGQGMGQIGFNVMLAGLQIPASWTWKCTV
jgi:hypothetical protein